jgi:hypothetical protein
MPRRRSELVGGVAEERSPFTAPLEALRATEADLQRQLSETPLGQQLAAARNAIAALEGLVAAATPVPSVAPAGARVGRSRSPEGRLLDALRGGVSMLGAELRERTGLSRYDIKQAVNQGLIVATGQTNGRRYSLPSGKGAAKEAP